MICCFCSFFACTFFPASKWSTDLKELDHTYNAAPSTPKTNAQRSKNFFFSVLEVVVLNLGLCFTPALYVSFTSSRKCDQTCPLLIHVARHQNLRNLYIKGRITSHSPHLFSVSHQVHNKQSAGWNFGTLPASFYQFSSTSHLMLIFKYQSLPALLVGTASSSLNMSYAELYQAAIDRWVNSLAVQSLDLVMRYEQLQWFIEKLHNYMAFKLDVPLSRGE